MAKANINGNSIEVNASVVNGALADVVYEISGKDAPKLHNTLMDVGVKPSDLFDDGHFTISKKQLVNPDMNIPFLKILDKKLDAALPH